MSAKDLGTFDYYMVRTSRDSSVIKFEYVLKNSGLIFNTEEPYHIITKDSDLYLQWKIQRSTEMDLEPLHERKYKLNSVHKWHKITLEKCDLNFELTLRVELNGLILLEEKIHRKSVLPKVWDDLNISIPLSSTLRMIVEVRRLVESSEFQLENYNRILESKKFYDVTFIIDNESFPANTEILSLRSPVFTSMFETDMLEKNNCMVEVTDIEPHIFEILLNFMYRGKVEESLKVDDMLKLFVAADKYCISSLVSICENLITGMLTLDCVIDVFIIADFVKADVLKGACKTLIFKNKTQVIKTRSYKNLIMSHPDLLSELFCEI